MFKKQKFLKNLLTSVSVASVVASIGGSSVAFGDLDLDPTNDGNKDIQLTADLANTGGSAIFNVDNLSLRVVETSPNALEGIIVMGAGANAIIDNDISIGTITTNKNVMDVIINTGKTLTLSGHEHTGLGITTLANAGSTLKLEANATINNAVTTAVGGQGILTFEGVGTANREIGANAAAVAEVNIGNGAVTLNENVFAVNTKFENVNSVINLKDGKTIKGNIITTHVNQGKLNFLGGGEVDGNIGTNAAALNVISLQAGDVILKGDVFTEHLKYYSDTGTADNKTVTIAGNFGDNDYTGKVDFSPNKANILTFKGAIRAEPYIFNSEIENGNNGTLNVQANLRATHADMGKINTINIGTASVNNNRTLIIDASKNNVTLLGNGATINFLHANSVLKLYSNAEDNKTITFANSLEGGVVDAEGLRGGNGGIVSMHGDNTLIVQSAGGDKTLGIAANKIEQLQVRGNVTIRGDNVNLNVANHNRLDVSNTNVLNVINGAEFIDESATSSKIANVHIGVPEDGGDAGAATYTIDAKYNDFSILDAKIGGVGNNSIIFEHQESHLILRNSANANKTITLANSLNPGASVNGKGQGIVQLESVHIDKTLRIACGGAETLGTDANYLQELTLSGAGKLAIEPAIYAKIITLSTGAEITTNDVNGNVIFDKAATLIVDPDHSIMGDVTFDANGGTLRGNVNGSVGFTATAQLIGNVTTDVIFNANGKLVGNVGGNVFFASAGTTTGTVAGDVVILDGGDGTVGGLISNNVAFNGDGKLTANGSIQGDVYFDHNKGTVTLADKQKIGGIIEDGEDATVEFLGDGEVGGLIDGLKLLKAGAGNMTLAASGNHNITEIQGNGKNDLMFATGFNLAGGINLTGGQAVGLIFEGNSSISGNVGTNAPVGNIQIQAGTVTFDSLIKANDIIIAEKATAEIAKNITAREIKGKGTVRFNNKDKIVIDSPIGDDTTMEIAGANVEAIKKVSAANIIFSSDKSATLTLKAASTINNITTTGNNLYSLALAADCSTGISDIGSDTSKLEINLLSDHTITINSKKFYSAVSTEKNNSGKVVFKSYDSVAYGNLGTDTLRLSDVTFDDNSTVKADIYSKKITINADKTASFAGINKRTIAVPGININGVELPRVSKEFSYYTLIDSENIDAKPSSKIKFDNAALIKAPINDGQVILADNVWFKGKVDSTAPVSFANKYVILEKDIKFASIEASQAKIILLTGNQAITGNLAAKDLTIDIGNNQLKYAGNAQLTGTLQLEAVYDSSKMAGGNIEIQSKSKLDLSQLDKLNIKVIARSDINKISEDTKHILVSSVDKDGITVIDEDKVKLVSVNEQSRFVEWSIDPSTLTLYAKDISKKVLEEELKEAKDIKEEKETQEGEEVKGNSKEELEKKLKESKGKKEEKKIKGKTQQGEETKERTKELRKSDIKLSSEKIAFKEQLIKVSDRKSDAAKLISQLGFMDKKNEYLAIDKLLPGNKHLMEQSSMNSTSAVMTLMSQAVANQITARATACVGAGNDDKAMYGVWGSPFYSTANQKMQEGVSGYNMKSSGLIVGFDGLLTDNLLIGGAYSLIDTKMSHKNQKSGDRTNGQTNIFSLYGVYKFAVNWFAESIASYGITKVKNLEGRLVSGNLRSVTALEKAVAKYQSTSYGGQLVTGYNYQASKQLTITPTIGFRYSQFMDAGYTESGTTCQNLVVKKRTYNKVEGIFGLRTAANIQLDQLLLIPEVHGYVNYDFKGKSPVIDARLGGIDEALPTKLVKPDRLFFNVGTSLTAKHNMMEYGVSYNAHIASKYIGHQGSVKVKVNF
jgi:outer membrane autotransporter protein